ncbi:MAG TPA: hypothetical protein VHT51_10860 [Micropepsaceae bacterium]|nr:hypothetical protein [Micropepsaceae bacterium]
MPKLRHFFSLLAFIACHAAAPLAMSDRVERLQIYPVHYGTNSLNVNGREVMIVKGAYKTETAAGGDQYFVLARQGAVWQLARHGLGGHDSTMITTAPHTGEDAIVSLYFMIPKVRGPQVSDLYLLVADRQFQNSIPEVTPVEFTLYVLERRNDDFGILYFRTVQKETAKEQYCSADLALYRELKIPLPYSGDERNYGCN